MVSVGSLCNYNFFTITQISKFNYNNLCTNVPEHVAFCDSAPRAIAGLKKSD